MHMRCENFFLVVQIGASYLCNKGRLGENEAVGNRTDMFAQETLRDSIRIIAKQDPEAARLIKLEMELSKAGLSRNLGVHVSGLHTTLFSTALCLKPAA